MTKEFAYISTGHSLRLTELDEHEYFGEDFCKGKMEPAIFVSTRTEKKYVVWTSGSWKDYELKTNDEVLFNCANRRLWPQKMKFLRSFHIHQWVNMDTNNQKFPKLRQWTLK